MKNRQSIRWFFLASSLVVFVVSYTIIDRITLRAAQLANNTMDAEYDSRSLMYALSVTAVYSIIFYLFVRDISKD